MGGATGGTLRESGAEYEVVEEENEEEADVTLNSINPTLKGGEI